jgi:hypothetical protein
MTNSEIFADALARVFSNCLDRGANLPLSFGAKGANGAVILGSVDKHGDLVLENEDFVWIQFPIEVRVYDGTRGFLVHIINNSEPQGSA